MPKSIDQELAELMRMALTLREQSARWTLRSLSAHKAGYPNLAQRNLRHAEALAEAASQIEHLIQTPN